MGPFLPDDGVVRRWAVPGPVILALLAGSLASVLDPAIGETIGVTGMAAGQLTGAVLTWRRSRRLEPTERRAWAYLAVGMLAVGSGIVAVGVLSAIGITVPAVGPVDLLFLSGYALLLVFFYHLARSDREGRDWLPTILDAAVGAIALSAMAWAFLYHDLVEGIEGASAWEAMAALSYPVLDVAVVVGLIILVNRRSHFRLDLRLIFLATGLGFQVIADILYLHGGIDRPFSELEPNYPLFLLATAGYLATAALADRVPRRREFPERESRLFSYVWPYLLAVALLAAHVVEYRSLGAGTDRVLLLDALLAIGGLIFLRQLYMIQRNRVRVDRQRSELVASVSHELRTPLTAMVGYLTLLEQDGEEFPEEARKEMLAEATDQARHIARLVSDLVLVARDQRQMPLEITEGELAVVVDDALRGIDIDRVRIVEELASNPLIRVDKDRLRQALVNLVSNAVRYGGDEVVIAARVEGRDLVIEVHDSGEGVPVRHEHAIWQRFERGAHRFNAATPGMGIGLAIVQAIAGAHGGIASYRRSELLGGACFSITIPGCVVVREPHRVEV